MLTIWYRLHHDPAHSSHVSSPMIRQLHKTYLMRSRKASNMDSLTPPTLHIHPPQWQDSSTTLRDPEWHPMWTPWLCPPLLQSSPMIGQLHKTYLMRSRKAFNVNTPPNFLIHPPQWYDSCTKPTRWDQWRHLTWTPWPHPLFSYIPPNDRTVPQNLPDEIMEGIQFGHPTHFSHTSSPMIGQLHKTYLMRSRKASNVDTWAVSAPWPSSPLMEGLPGWMDSTQMIPTIAAKMVVEK